MRTIRQRSVVMGRYGIDSLSVVCIVCLLCVSCQRRTATDFSLDLNRLDSLSFYDYFSRFEIIPLQLDGNMSITYGRTDWKMYNGNHYILDKHSNLLFVFDGEGHLISEINHLGHGHGEYREANDFQLNPYTGNLEILEPMRGIRVYDPTGETFIEQFDIPVPAAHFFTSLSSDVYILYSTTRMEECKMLFYSKSQNKIIAEDYPVPSFLFLVTPWHPSGNPFFRCDGELYLSQNHDGSIFRVNQDCTIEVRYQWNFGKHNFPLDKLPENEDVEWYMDYFRREASRHVHNFCFNAENDRYFMNSFMYGNKYYSLIYDKNSERCRVIHSFNEQMMLYPAKMDDEALYYMIPGWFADRWSKDNGGQLVFPSDDPDAMYIVKYYFKQDE